jgi:CubicO group peptidase (beta-lactamase class C family)
MNPSLISQDEKHRAGHFDSTIIEAMKTSNVPGAAILIIADRQIKYTKGYGLADPENGRVVAPDTLFTIASISKIVTATALMTLYEQKKLALDDDINLYLPFQVRNSNFPDTPITFRMLLSHTSTLKDSEIFYDYYTLKKTPVLPDSPILLGDFLKDYLCTDGKLYNISDNFMKAKPGTTYAYSNIGFGLLGFLTECISGIQFNAYCRKNIFDPLGMSNTTWHFKDVDLDRMAIPYGYDNDLHQPIRYDFYSYPTYPDGALKTSVNEFARFLFVFINEGKTIDGKSFLRAETVKEMLTLHQFPGMEQGEAVGLAWHFDGHVYWHNGVDPGISTLTYFNQDTGQGTIFFSNGTNFDVSVPFMEDTIRNFIGLNQHDNMTHVLNELSDAVNKRYGFVTIPGDNFGEPAINSGPCGPFAYAFYTLWNQRFAEKVSIVFIMVKYSDECWHVLIRLPDGRLFDGGCGVHNEERYKDKFEIEDMLEFDLQRLERNAHGLSRTYPRYCPDFSMDVVSDLISLHFDKIECAGKGGGWNWILKE